MSRFLRIGEIIINPKWISYMSINAQGCKIRIAPMEIDGWWIAGSGSVQSDFKYVEVKKEDQPNEYDKIKKWIEENSE
jgi:hypothetical protein